MSEIPLRYLIDCYASDGEAWEIKHYSLSELMDARITRAEAGEKAMESWLAWCDIGDVDGTWDAFAKAVADYRAAKEAVRKLEEGT